MKKIFVLLLVLLMIVPTNIVLAAGGAEYKVSIEAQFDDAQFFSECYAAVRVGDKWGYIDENGNRLVEPQYDYAAEFSEGKAVVGMFNEDYAQDGIWGTCTVGFIDTTGKYTPLTAEKYLIDNLWVYGEPASTDQTEVIPKIPIATCLFECDFEANVVKEPKLWAYTDGYLYIYEQNGDGSFFGYFDENGKMINPYIGFKPDYDSAAGESWCTAIFNGIYSDGLVSATPDYAGSETIDIYDIDKNLQFSKPSTGYSGYEEAGIEAIYRFTSSEEAEEAKQKLDALNIDYFYADIWPFHDGYAAAWVVKNEGAKITEHTYTFGERTVTEYSVGFFSDDDYASWYDGNDNARFALIDKKGNMIFTGDYTRVMHTGFDRLNVLNNGRIVLKNSSDKWGAVDKAGNVIIPFEYDEMGVFMDTVTSAKKNGKWCYIDIDGKVISETDYEFLAGQNPESKASIATKNDTFFVVIDGKQVPGSEKIAKDKYFNTDYGYIVPDDTIIIKDGEKYGYAALDDGKPQTTVTSVGVKIDWRNPNKDGYRIYRAETGEKPEAISGVIYGDSFVDVNVESDKKYYYAVVPESKGNISVLDENVSAEAVTGTILQPEKTDGKNFILMQIGSPNMTVGEEVLEIDPGRGTAPLVQNDRTLVPIRTIVEAMGGTVEWNEAEQKVTLNVGGHNVQMTLGQKQFVVDGEVKEMDIAPETILDRTMLPIRFAAENVGCQIEWIGSTQEIVIVF